MPGFTQAFRRLSMSALGLPGGDAPRDAKAARAPSPAAAAGPAASPLSPQRALSFDSRPPAGDAARPPAGPAVSPLSPGDSPLSATPSASLLTVPGAATDEPASASEDSPPPGPTYATLRLRDLSIGVSATLDPQGRMSVHPEATFERRYEVRARGAGDVKRGGGGRVFAVRCRPGIPNPAGDKTVRLLGKSISRNHSHYPTLESYALRCLREWLAASSAPHPNVCRTFEMLFDDRRGRFILVLEYCSGGDLAAWLGGDRPAAQKLRAWKGVAEALNHMHAFGFAHRDIKAHNVLLQDGAAKLADFGSAVCAGRGHPEGVTCGGCPPGGPKWCLGRSGTVSWMAPELFTDEPYDPVLADLFSLGLLLYALFAKRPFSAALPSEHGWKQWSEKGVLPKGDLAALAKVGAVECAKGLMAPLPEDRAEAWRAVRASEWYRGLPC